MFLATICLILPACSKPEPTLEESVALANQHLAAGRLDQAINLLDQLNKEHPLTPSVIEPLAFAYAERNDHEMAAFYFDQLADTGTAERQFLLYSAQSLIQSGDLEAAAERYRRYVTDFPDSGPEWKKLGELYEKLGKSSEAVEAYLSSYSMKQSGEIAVRLGKIFQRLNNTPQAERWYQTAIESPDDAEPDALLGLLEIALQKKNFAVAENIINTLDTKYPGRLDISRLASKREELANWRKQQDDLAQKLAEQQRIARELREKAEREAAEAAARAAAEKAAEEERARREAELAANPPEPTTESNLSAARKAKENGDYESAIKSYWAALKLDDHPAQLWFELSDAYYLSDQMKWAEATALEAKRREPFSPLYTLQYLKVAQKTKAPEEFLQALIHAKEKIPDSPDITLALARGYLKIKKSYRNAAILYQEFLDMAPGHPQRAEAESELNTIPPFEVP